MKRLLLLAALSVSFPILVQASDMEHTSWGYVGAGAASRWAELSPEYKTCGAGKKQSPVNIEEYGQSPNFSPLLPMYHPSPLDIANDGRSLQVNVAPGSQMSIGGKVYNLLQFRFHTPSEHYLDGAPYPMEIQFYHLSPDDGEVSIIAAMIKIGKHNKVIEALWNNAPATGGHRQVDFNLLASDLLPPRLDYYGYEGSLTTPPCTEGVKWHVLQNPIEISEDQLRRFQALFPVNSRPVQPLNGRQVVGQ